LEVVDSKNLRPEDVYVKASRDGDQPAVARIVAASAFKEFLVPRSLALECGTTSREGSGGRLNFALT